MAGRRAKEMERWRKMRRRTWNNQGLCITHCNVNDTAVIINSILYIVPNMNSNYSHNYFNNSGISFGVFFPKKQRVEQSFNTKNIFSSTVINGGDYSQLLKSQYFFLNSVTLIVWITSISFSDPYNFGIQNSTVRPAEFNPQAAI